MFDVLNQAMPDRHVPILRGMADALRPGGIIAFREPAMSVARGWHDTAVNIQKRFDKPGLTSLLRAAGFEPLRITYLNTLLFPPIVLLRQLQRMKQPTLAKSDVEDTAEPINSVLLGLLQIVQSQIVWIDGEESDASVDSELALVQNADYPYYRWQPNPLNLHHSPTPLRAIMVSRIDAPTPAVARRIIDESVSVEASGLSGKIVIDSRGIAASPQVGGYGWFDQILRDTAAYLKKKSNLEVVADDRAQVILPGTVRDAALYCGWYSLRQYIASCSYEPGAVAYHVASLEMVSLHAPREKGWVPNLLNDGVDATLGAVGEPYLGSFPRPDEFFPLLMTGKATLAEAYWAACPMTSWKITLIGDPLYRPFAAKPALSDAELSPELGAALRNFAATPASGR